jgi:hypothetical protein
MALLTKLQIEGRVRHLLMRPGRAGGFEKSPSGSIVLTLDGPQGDCHSGATRKSDSRTTVLYNKGIDIRNVRQLTLLSDEELREIAAALGVPAVKAEWLGGNIVTSGIPDLTLMPPSTRLQFPSGATIVVDMENLPCGQIAATVGRHYPEAQRMLVKCAMHKRGVTAWVEREGVIKVDDVITLFLPPQRIYSHT